MSDEDDGRGPNDKALRQVARAERLAAELRANLQRRKVQARARREPPSGGAGEAGTGTDKAPPRE